MRLAFQDYEQEALRGDVITTRFTQEQQRTYHVSYDYVLGTIPRWGESITLKDSPWETQAAIMLPRLKSIQVQKHPEARFWVVVANWYQIRRYSGTATTSPQELMGSREGVDSGHYRNWDRYFASSDGSSGVTEGDGYPGEDPDNDEHPRVCQFITTNKETLPGLYFHKVHYFGFKEYI